MTPCLDPSPVRHFREASRRTIVAASRHGAIPAAAGRRLSLLLGRLPLEPHGQSPRHEPAVRWLPQARRAARRGPLARLMRHAEPLLPCLPWVEEYADQAIARDLHQKYAHADVAGRLGVLPADGVRLGFVILGPRAFYPAHAHAADEVYVLLGGGAWWRGGDQAWRWRPPGATIHHPARLPHAMRTGPHPVLAVYAWWGQVDRPAGFLRPWATRSPAGRRRRGS